MRIRDVLTAGTLALAVLATPMTSAAAQPLDGAGAIVDAFEQARAAGDFSTALAQFADDAVITVQSGRATQVFAGRDQVRAYLLSVAMPARSLMRSAYRVDGPFVRWTERNEGP